MPNIDTILERLGLCRLSFFQKMKDNYSRIISMTQKRSQRLEARIETLNDETINLKTRLEESEFFRKYYEDLASPPDRMAAKLAWQARFTQGSRRYNG